ncbi:MAG: hypothetical protein FWC50_04615 [Planctomycetaceae bacterium]|nr:hypothetical protein [Planctomycetaceae bacterium]
MDRTPYQDKIIKSYYKNRDTLMWQKLAELATELYLAEGKKRDSLWKRVRTAMKNLGLSEERINQIVATDNPALIASLVQKEME